MTETNMICPVSKSSVDVASAINSGDASEYNGKVFYFCCTGCKIKFDKTPEQYLVDLPENETSHSGCGCGGGCC